MTWRFTQLQHTCSEVTSVLNHALFCRVYNRSEYIISVKPRGILYPHRSESLVKKCNLISASNVGCFRNILRIQYN